MPGSAWLEYVKLAGNHVRPCLAVFVSVLLECRFLLAIPCPIALCASCWNGISDTMTACRLALRVASMSPVLLTPKTRWRYSCRTSVQTREFDITSREAWAVSRSTLQASVF